MKALVRDPAPVSWIFVFIGTLLGVGPYSLKALGEGEGG